MAFDVHISDEAQIELGIAECYFRTRNLHTEFLQDFFRQIDLLETHPESFQIKYRDIRIVYFDDFNYSIHYIMTPKRVVILRILNQRQQF